MALTDDTRIIFVHGLAAKPAEAVLMELWRKTLIANVRLDSPALADAMAGNDDLFRSGYWANAVPDHIEDSPEAVRQLRRSVNRVIRVRRGAGRDLHINTRGWIRAKIQKFGVGAVNGLARALTLKDEVLDHHLREVRLYHADQYIADRMRAPLERELREAWADGKQVILVTHSMGTFLAYDVLWRFSHRAEAVYRDWREQRVALLITMGSPLGDETLRRFMLIERWKKSPRAKIASERTRYYPTNVASWQNYAAYGDIVCHDSNLEDDLFAGMRRHVGGFGRNDLRDYVKLYNPYVSGEGKHNPHKSYGYLIQPKLSYNFRWFFGWP